MALKYLEMQRTDDSFEVFYDLVLRSSKDFADEPTLPRYSKQPRWIDDGEPGHRFENPRPILGRCTSKQLISVIESLLIASIRPN